jgi:FkbM family methyltransferase
VPVEFAPRADTGNQPSVKALARIIYRSLPYKRQVYSFLRNRLGLVPSFYQHLHFEGPFELAIDANRKITLLSAGDIVENELFWRGFGNSWEATSLKLWHRICNGSTGIILDIGANNGVYALVAGAVAPAAEVIAFEPIARIANHLRQNVAMNGFPIRVEQQAVSNEDGTRFIFDLPCAHNYSASLEGQGPLGEAVEVQVCSIDQFLGERSGDKSLSAVKIDVERHEPAVLAGMSGVLSKDRPPILVEVINREIGAAVEKEVQGLGYRMFQISEHAGLVPTDCLEPLIYPDWNQLLCTEEQFTRLALADFLVA